MKIISGFFLLFTASQLVFAEINWVSVEPTMRNVTVTGFTRAQAKMPLISEVSGKVSKIFADIGEDIPKSKIFACLDDTFTKIDIKSVENEISQNKVDIDFFAKEVIRHQQLVKKQISAIRVLDGLTRDLAKAKHELSSAVIRKQRLREQQRRHCIKAPAGWQVIKRHIEIGQWVNQGEVVAQIGNYSKLKVPLFLSVQELASLKQEKQNIKLISTDFNTEVAAIIEHISPAFDEKSRKILVDLLITENLPSFQGGMRVELVLKTTANARQDEFLIHKLAVEERFEEFWVQRKDGQRIRVKVLGDQGKNNVRIKSSKIKLGDQFKVSSH